MAYETRLSPDIGSYDYLHDSDYRQRRENDDWLYEDVEQRRQERERRKAERKAKKTRAQIIAAITAPPAKKLEDKGEDLF